MGCYIKCTFMILQLPEHNTHLEGKGDKICENVMQMRSCGKGGGNGGLQPQNCCRKFGAMPSVEQ